METFKDPDYGFSTAEEKGYFVGSNLLFERTNGEDIWLETGELSKGDQEIVEKILDTLGGNRYLVQVVAGCKAGGCLEHGLKELKTKYPDKNWDEVGKLVGSLSKDFGQS